MILVYISLIIRTVFLLQVSYLFSPCNIIIFFLSALLLIVCVLYVNNFSNKRNQVLKKLVKKRTKELEEKNTALRKQKNELEELNQLLEKRQERIENQSKNLRKSEEEYEQLSELLIKRQKRMEKQTEILKNHEKELEELNELLEKRQTNIEKQALKLKKQKNELEISNETKDKLFSIIAHDLKNPFNTILGFTDLIRSNFEMYDKKKLGEINNTLYETTKEIYKLIENLLSWSRAQMGTIQLSQEIIDVEQITNDIKNLLHSSAQKKNIQIVLKIEKGTEVYADRQMVHTVFRNLVTNSIKFTENGSITFISKTLPDKVEICIEDTGMGMNGDILENLFKISKVKSRKGTKGEGGTGLGMIICKEFIEMNNGSIRAESDVGKGSRFIIVLPRYKPV